MVTKRTLPCLNTGDTEETEATHLFAHTWHPSARDSTSGWSHRGGLKDPLRTYPPHRKESPSLQPCKKVSAGDSACHSSLQVERRPILKIKENRMGHCFGTFLKIALSCAKILVLPFHIIRQAGEKKRVYLYSAPKSTLYCV
jgi:hypothetical protein